MQIHHVFVVVIIQEKKGVNVVTKQEFLSDIKFHEEYEHFNVRKYNW